MSKFGKVIRDAESRNKLVRSDTHQTAIDFERLVSLVFGLPSLPDELRPLLKTADPRRPLDGQAVESAPIPKLSADQTQRATDPLPKPPATPTRAAPKISADGRRIYQSGEVVFSEGDPADVFFVIASGEVELRSEQEGSVLAQLGPGETFGEQSILMGGVRSLSAIAKTELEVTEVRADLLRDALATSPGLIRPSFEALLLQLYLSNSLQLRGHPSIH
ncbi:MAG: cyclic nucleotide-binding domain-containing protein [Betaproteobacteria bacterium]|nr:cyclic nucleotide-binding domain-containing protein [Betaproteobacteria bacterium]